MSRRCLPVSWNSESDILPGTHRNNSGSTALLDVRTPQSALPEQTEKAYLGRRRSPVAAGGEADGATGAAHVVGQRGNQSLGLLAPDLLA